MSLDYRLGKIANYATVCFDTFVGTQEEMQARVDRVAFFGPCWEWTDESKTAIKAVSVTTYMLIFASMQVGLREITAKNAATYFDRLSRLEGLYGAFRKSADGPVYFTREEVDAHIGLSTNVADVPTRTFNANLRKWAKRRAVEQAYAARRRADAQTNT